VRARRGGVEVRYQTPASTFFGPKSETESKLSKLRHPSWSARPRSRLLSSTHNESRLATGPLSGVPGRGRAPVNRYPRKFEDSRVCGPLDTAH
jgi:hypothetical protein